MRNGDSYLDDSKRNDDNPGVCVNENEEDCCEDEGCSHGEEQRADEYRIGQMFIITAIKVI